MRDSLGSTTKGLAMCSKQRLVALATLAFTIAACASSRASRSLALPRHGLRADLLGCYALYKPDGTLLDSTYYNSSPLVRLDSTLSGIPSDTGRTAFRDLIRLDSAGYPLDTGGPHSFFGRTWLADSLSDSITLAFSDGFSGAYAILAAPPDKTDTLSGRIEEHWDMGPSVNQRGPVRALRIQCRGAA